MKKIFLRLAKGGNDFMVELGPGEEMPPARIVSWIAGIHEPPFRARPILTLESEDYSLVVYEYDDEGGGDGYEIDWA